MFRYKSSPSATFHCRYRSHIWPNLGNFVFVFQSFLDLISSRVEIIKVFKKTSPLKLLCVSIRNLFTSGKRSLMCVENLTTFTFFAIVIQKCKQIITVINGNSLASVIRNYQGKKNFMTNA